MGNPRKNRNRQHFGVHQNTQGAQAITAQGTEAAVEKPLVKNGKAEQKTVANLETDLVFQGAKLKVSNLLLLALSSPKADKTGFSVQEMQLRKALREKIKNSDAEIVFEANEYRYLKALVLGVEYSFESEVLVDFAQNF